MFYPCPLPPANKVVGRQYFAFNHVCHSVRGGGAVVGVVNVTITHDTLDLTVQASLQTSDLGTYTPPVTDIWWPSLGIC